MLPCEDNFLRKITQERPSFRVARYENLPLDIERSIACILQREIEMTRRLDGLKRELEYRYDFSPYAAFKTVDRYTEGAITQCNLTTFLRQQGYFPSEREVLSIIRRMDTSCAASVSYSDFSDFLRGHGSSDVAASCGGSKTVASTSNLRSNSAGRNGQQSPAKIERESPNKPRSQS